jgi:EmrB/QacA subfamily drug resistance transporter
MPAPDRATQPGTAEPGTAQQPGPGPSGGVLTLLLTSVASFMVILDALVVVTALPSIHRDLGGGIGTLQWTVSAYTIAFGAGILTAAALGDRLGRRRVFVAGLALFTAASAACALAPNSTTLITFRVLQGMGAAIIMPLGLTLLTSAFPQERRGAVVGIMGGVTGLAVACGPLVGGAVTQDLTWHWIFWINVPVGAIALVGAGLCLPESRGPQNRLDIPALVLVSAGVGVLIWGLVQGSQLGWTSTQGLTGLILGPVLILSFLAWEARATEPMIPLKIFRSTTFSSAVSTQFLMSAAIYSAAFLTSQFFQFALGDSPLGTGLRFLPWTATPLLIAPAAGALSDKIGARTLVVPGLLMQGAGFAWIVASASHHSGYGGYVAPFIIAGVGISMALPCVTTAGLNAVPPVLLGKAAGTLNTLQQFGAVFGIAIVTAVFNTHGSLAGPAAVTSGYRPALAVAAGLSVLGAVVAVGIRRAARTHAVGSSPRPEETPAPEAIEHR